MVSFSCIKVLFIVGVLILALINLYISCTYFLYLLISISLSIFLTLPYIFFPSLRCTLPGLRNDTYKSQGKWHDQRVKDSIPWDDDEEDYSFCKLYSSDPNTGQRTNKTFECSKWVYSHEIFDTTFIGDVSLFLFFCSCFLLTLPFSLFHHHQLKRIIKKKN